MSSWVYLNDDFIPAENAKISYRDLSFQRGYGIFDFLKVDDNRALFSDEHLQRFFSSAKAMHLPLTKTKEDLNGIMEELIRRNRQPHSGIRLGLTGGFSPDGYSIATPTLLVSQHLFAPVSEEQFQKGIRLMTHQHQRQLPRVKTIDYLMAIWLQPLLRQKGADDVLYHDNGIVTECPRANFFLLTKKDELITTPELVLNGITRKRILLAAAPHFHTEERPITLTDLKEAREAFITSTTKGVLPVARIDDLTFSPSFSAARKISSLLREEVQQVHKAAAE